jgi:hypothetical protein
VPDRPITARTVEKACRDAREAAGLGVCPSIAFPR